MSITDFEIIRSSYPIFEAKIEEEVNKRKQDLLEKTGSKVIDSKVISFRSDPKLLVRKRQSLKGSNKGSRQSAYEVEDDTDTINPRFRSRLNALDPNILHYK